MRELLNGKALIKHAENVLFETSLQNNHAFMEYLYRVMSSAVKHNATQLSIELKAYGVLEIENDGDVLSYDNLYNLIYMKRNKGETGSAKSLKCTKFATKMSVYGKIVRTHSTTAFAMCGSKVWKCNKDVRSAMQGMIKSLEYSAITDDTPSFGVQLRLNEDQDYAEMLTTFANNIPMFLALLNVRLKVKVNVLGWHTEVSRDNDKLTFDDMTYSVIRYRNKTGTIAVIHDKNTVITFPSVAVKNINKDFEPFEQGLPEKSFGFMYSCANAYYKDIVREAIAADPKSFILWYTALQEPSWMDEEYKKETHKLTEQDVIFALERVDIIEDPNLKERERVDKSLYDLLCECVADNDWEFPTCVYRSNNFDVLQKYMHAMGYNFSKVCHYKYNTADHGYLLMLDDNFAVRLEKNQLCVYSVSSDASGVVTIPIRIWNFIERNDANLILLMKDVNGHTTVLDPKKYCESVQLRLNLDKS